MTYLLILAGYALLMIALGIFFARRVRTSSDFYVARRDLSATLLMATLLAANIGAGSTVGATGLGYRDGLSALWWVGSAGIGSLILALTVGPRIWTVAKQHNLYTVGDYLEFRYNRLVRSLVAVFLWVGSLSILAGQLMAIAWILDVTVGLRKPLGCLVGALVATIYFAAGGLAGTARVNLLQLVIKLVGFGGALAWLLDDSGGWSGIRAAVELRDPLHHLDPLGSGSNAWWRYLIMLAPSFVISPGLLQKVFGARSPADVRRGVGLNALFLLSFAIIPTIYGLIAYVRFPDLANRELAMPTLLIEALPLWLGGLLLGALFAAEVSTADTVIFMLSTSVVRDLYQIRVEPAADDHRLILVTRFVALLCGAGGAILAIYLDTVVAALTIFYTLLTAALLWPVVAGLYLPRVTARGAALSIIVSIGLTMLLEMANRMGWAGPGGVPAIPLIWGVLGGGVAMIIGSLPAGRS
ncbi:MAG: sodium:solute symporter family protein [Acidobacteriota bacterium]